MRVAASFLIATLFVSACAIDEFEALPEPPELLGPAYGDVFNEARVTFYWQAVDLAEAYEVRIDGRVAAETTATQATLEFAFRRDAYCWQIYARRTLQYYPSNQRCFFVLPVAPTPITPIDRERFCAEDTVSLTWTAVPSAVGYLVRVRTPTGEHLFDPARQVSTPSLTLPADLPAGDYSWTVTTLTEGGATSAPSEAGSFVKIEVAAPEALTATFNATDSTTVDTRWESGRLDHELEIRRGSCAQPGTRLPGWPQRVTGLALSVENAVVDPSEPLSVRVRTFEGDCPSPWTCVEVMPPNTQSCDPAVGPLTWYDVTPSTYEAGRAEPGIAWDPFGRTFIRRSFSITSRLFLHTGGSGEDFDLSPTVGNLGTFAEHIEGGLVYDSVGERFLLFSPNLFENTTLQLPLNPLGPWQHVATLGSPQLPLVRADHVSIHDPVRNRLIVYGGWDEDDLWSLDLNQSPAVWTQIHDGGEGVPPHWGMVGWYEAETDSMLFFGGTNATATRFNDVYRLDLQTDTWSLVPTDGDTPPRVYEYGGAFCDCYFVVSHGLLSSDGSLVTDETYVLNAEKTWHKVAVSGTAPPADWGFDAAWDPINRVVFMIGGSFNSPNLSRVYMLTGL